MIDFVKDNFIWIAGLITAAKWVYEYSQKLKWEKSRMLIDRLETFLQRDSTENVHHMLDWNRVKIDVAGNKVLVSDEIVFEALQTHDKKTKFSETELEIRDLFDDYFDGLTEFLILSECGLLSKKDFRKFMSYWIEILNGKSRRKSPELQKQIEEYLIFYGFKKLHRFIHSRPVFGYQF